MLVMLCLSDELFEDLSQSSDDGVVKDPVGSNNTCCEHNALPQRVCSQLREA